MLKYQKGYICNGYTFVVNKEDVHNARDEMFVEATALLPDGWISVKERLPERGERVLVTNGGFVCESYLNGYGRWKRGGANLSFMTPTHWAAMPEPPEEDNDDK